MKNTKPYPVMQFICGLCALAGGAMGIALGLRGETMYLILGIIALVAGVYIFYSMSKQ
jgi:hypothetical protein